VKRREKGLDFEVDKLTNSIENVITGDSFQTDISLVSRVDLKSATRANGWVFNWVAEFREPVRDVYKLTITNNPSVIQGLISLEVKDTHVCLHLIEL
jgi:hypothetical protein